MKLGLVTILYNSDNVLDDFLRSVAAQSHTDYILYIVDNSANPDTDKLLAQLLEQYQLSGKTLHVKSSGNYGVAKGNNIGIRKALEDNCEGIIVLNNDIAFGNTDLFRILTDKAKVHPIIAPKVYDIENNIWYAGGKMDNFRALSLHINEGKPDDPADTQDRITGYAPTCFVLFNRIVFEKVGLMDEKYFVYWDDTDFMQRAIKQGFNILYTPQVDILHKVSNSTGGRASLFTIYYFLRNRLYFIHKHYHGLKKVIPTLYVYFTTTVKLVIYDKAKKEVLRKALKDYREMIR